MADRDLQAALISGLKLRLSTSRAFPDAPMSRYTTLRLGGPADLLVDLGSPEDLGACFDVAASLGAPVRIIGNGSNLLVPDEGLRGLTVRLGDRFSQIQELREGEDGFFLLETQAGATLQKLCNAALTASLAGLEFASGIPGTVGGAVCMNAGAYGGEIGNGILSVSLMERDGTRRVLSREEMAFSYRHTVLSDEKNPGVVLGAVFALRKGDRELIETVMRGFSEKRREKQPLSVPSCGSTFKRPEGHFAGALIEECGLKGLRVGGCSVSEMHAGFLVNDQEGTAADYLELMRLVQERVLAETGVLLEPEVRILTNEEETA